MSSGHAHIPVDPPRGINQPTCERSPRNSTVARPAGSDTLTAAVPGPSIPAHGTAIETRPTSYSSSETATPGITNRCQVGGQIASMLVRWCDR